jgi:hypothetical protein
MRSTSKAPEKRSAIDEMRSGSLQRLDAISPSLPEIQREMETAKVAPSLQGADISDIKAAPHLPSVATLRDCKGIYIAYLWRLSLSVISRKGL